MGLIRELCSEIMDLPEQFKTTFDDNDTNKVILFFTKKYAIVNLFFQIIDCIIIPLFTLMLVNGNKNFVTSILIIVLGLSSIFSIIQFIYYLINPTQKYINVFHQIIGETAIGIFFASLLNIPIKQYIK
jgi:hypothetical protein